uniref:Uncharacterized protein AlNc14C155G7627 n=1 Tax=Albugo laibachii Nc14 TaxID=890382 RepID=F0WMC2_9STRA|nr:conserved hypothetical protein [Albugo laibachii Nc14]|eukprot:CCA22453.1 conserved hypothetical protein [Albugo laibachii Nc14]
MTTVVKMESTNDANGLADLSGSGFSYPDNYDLLIGDMDFGSSHLFPSTPEAFSRSRNHSLCCVATEPLRIGENNEAEANTHTSSTGDDFLEPLDLSLTDLFSIQDEDLHGLIGDSFGDHDTNSLFPFETFSVDPNQDIVSGHKSPDDTRGASPVPRSCDDHHHYNHSELTPARKESYTFLNSTSVAAKSLQEAHSSIRDASQFIRVTGQKRSSQIAGMHNIHNVAAGQVFPIENTVNPYSVMPFIPIMNAQHMLSTPNSIHHADQHGSLAIFPSTNSHTFFIDADCTIPWTGGDMSSYHIPVPDSSFQDFANHNFVPVHRRAKQCVVENCTRRAQSNNRCKTHGGGARCQIEGCDKSSQGGGLCRAHGGGKKCGIVGCTKGTQRLGLCYLHGGIRRCMSAGCKKKDRGNGFCISHGGGRRCQVAGCVRSVRKGNYCQAHYSLDHRIS